MTDLIDFHSHVLPRADHGSSSVKDSLCQLSMARQSGVTRIVATPHFYPARESVEKFLARRNASYQHLMESLTGDMPELRLGAEVLICDNFENLPGVESLCIHGTHTLLLELPFSDFDKRYKTTVSSLVKRGIDVVLAHADRYDADNINLLVSAGARIQLNAKALSGFFKNRQLYQWIDAGLVDGIGSDIHGTDKSAYKSFVTAQHKIGDERLAKIAENSDKIWNKSLIFN